mmetsp:Transcript_21272/g.49346  ORF Transcript_21272/g.49346 Transcript_21272/m.49346 type:complete len:251 (+) Transcript_21272:943-1695(+)
MNDIKVRTHMDNGVADRLQDGVERELSHLGHTHLGSGMSFGSGPVLNSKAHCAEDHCGESLIKDEPQHVTLSKHPLGQSLITRTKPQISPARQASIGHVQYDGQRQVAQDDSKRSSQCEHRVALEDHHEHILQAPNLPSQPCHCKTMKQVSTRVSEMLRIEDEEDTQADERCNQGDGVSRWISSTLRVTPAACISCHDDICQHHCTHMNHNLQEQSAVVKTPCLRYQLPVVRLHECFSHRKRPRGNPFLI